MGGKWCCTSDRIFQVLFLSDLFSGVLSQELMTEKHINYKISQYLFYFNIQFVHSLHLKLLKFFTVEWIERICQQRANRSKILPGNACHFDTSTCSEVNNSLCFHKSWSWPPILKKCDIDLLQVLIRTANSWQNSFQEAGIKYTFR